MRFYFVPLRVVVILFLPAIIRGNLDENNQLLAHHEGRELKKGQFSCGASSPTLYCLKERQLCDTSTGKALCICAEGWKGARCQNRIDEPPSTPPTKMPTSSRVGSACTLSSDCATENSYCFEGQCRCQSGFSPRKGNCINVNECAERGINGCHRDALCIDTEGSYECSCKLGFSDTNPTLPGRQCEQANECNLGTHNCDAATQVCLDRRPPEKWECVQQTPAPTPKPTRPPTPPPTPPPTSPPTICFSGDTSVIVKGRGKVSMGHLKIGDLVLVKANVYEPIIASGHRDFHHHSEFLSITTNSTSENALEMSSDHILFLYHQHFPLPSKMLQIGDILIGSNNEPLEVRSIQTVKKRGIFSPLTPSGKIVVNGILCSNYAFSMNKIESDGTYFLFYGLRVMTLHSFHHMRNSPLRLATLGMPRLSYLEDEEGKHIFFTFYQNVYSTKSNNNSSWSQMIGHVIWNLLLLFSFVCFTLEQVIGFHWTLMLCILVLFNIKASINLLKNK